MKEVKITIPNNCELVKEGDSYVIKKKKNTPPRSWKEFCKNYRIANGEAFIDIEGVINIYKDSEVRAVSDKILCTSKAEAEAFLALMQLRQLRKAWEEDFKQKESHGCAILVHDLKSDSVVVHYGLNWASSPLFFSSTAIANDFLSCFKDLCETAKILL